MPKPPRAGTATGVGGRGTARLVRPPARLLNQAAPPAGGAAPADPNAVPGAANAQAPARAGAAPVGALDNLYGANRDAATKRDWNGNVTVNRGARETASLVSIFGRDLTDKEVGQLFGAPDGATIRLSGSGNSMNISVSHPWYQAQQRTLTRDGNTITMDNDLYKLSDAGKAVKGVGTRVLSYQAEAARRLGVTQLKTYAAQGGDYVGYNAWARMGYDGQIIPTRLANLPSEVRGMRIQTINDLMLAHGARQAANPGDRLLADWWRNTNNGHGFQGTFSLDPNSTSWKVNQAYRRESGINLGF